MTIGDMRERIILVNPKKIPNPRGGWSIDYTTGDRIETWAAATLLTVNQQLRYQQADSVATMEFEIRKNPFVKKETRIFFEGVGYQIEQFGPNPQKDTRTIIRAREV